MGAADCVMKPVLPGELKDCLESLLGSGRPCASGTPAAPAAAVPRKSGQRLRILLAEDNVVNQILAVRLLEKRGHSVKTAANGKEVLAALQEGPFDLVLMDVQMPEMDGIKAASVIRQIEEQVRQGSLSVSECSTYGLQAHGEGGIPIVAMTASVSKADQDRIIEAGMNGFISKPLQSHELFGILARWIPLVSPEPEDEVAALNVPMVLRTLEGDEQLLEELISVFLTEAPRLRQNLRQAIGARDSHQTEAAVCALKGAVSPFHVADVNNILRLLEQSDRQQDWQNLEYGLGKLEPAMERMLASLTALMRKGRT
jgi:two-component system, sensor histidine kinase and response regulator